MAQDDQLTIRPLTRAEQERGLQALEELERLSQELRGKRDSKDFSPSWTLLNQTHEERVMLAQAVRDIVDRIVAVAHPRLVVLFGSVARGDSGPNSDLDFLVVVDEPVHRRHLAHAIYRELVGIGTAADIVVVSTEDVLRHGRDANMVIRPALEEGKILYAA